MEMKLTSNVIDLSAEAAKREVRFPDGIIVKLGDDTFTLPAELPVVALDPLFDVDVDLASVLAQAVKLANSGSDESNVGLEVVADILLSNPNLPKDVWMALRRSLAVLFGEEQWARFDSLALTLPTYIALIKNVVRMYGTTLGEAFGSASPSVDNGGEMSSGTAGSSTKSTRAVSSRTRAKKVSSESDGS